MCYKFKICTLLFVLFISNLSFSSGQKDQDYVFEIFGNKYSYKEIEKLDRAFFFDLEKKKYEKINQIAQELFLKEFWKKKAQSLSTTADKASLEYMKEKVTVTDKEIEHTLKQFKNHPKIKQLSDKDQKIQIKNYLISSKRSKEIEEIIKNGLSSKNLSVVYPKPQEPIYNLTINDTDEIRYGPKDEDVRPTGCKGNECLITVVEYSEFQCPFCARAIPTINKVLSKYRGKIRWIVRDFPLSFHDRAKPAAIAAKCAGFQGKFWQMYTLLFSDQKNLTDQQFNQYAKSLKLDEDKFINCYKSSQKAKDIVEKNFDSGAKLGVTGTPAFFINGKRLSGALPYEEFERVIEDEIKKNKIR